MRVAVVIPTLNPGQSFSKLLTQLDKQNCDFVYKLIIDSESTDATLNLSQEHQCHIMWQPQSSFNHGKTRQVCIDYLEHQADIVVFITQDILFYDGNSIGNLLKAFQDEQVGAAYGRQLPHEGASSIAAQARLFNYPEQSRMKSYEDKEVLGIKAPFMSDSFAAYRVKALQAAGGFPHAIVSEDMYVGAKMLKLGYKIAYVADAKVYHSHDYTFIEEFKRYFDIGVFQAREGWIRDEFGKAEGEGVKLVLDQLRFLVDKKEFLNIAKAIVANSFRIFGYKMGLKEKMIPKKYKKILSGQPYFFNS
jgi:rhamnosyltransferase